MGIRIKQLDRVQAWGDFHVVVGAGAVPPGAYCQTPQCHLVKRPRQRGLPD